MYTHATYNVYTCYIQCIHMLHTMYTHATYNVNTCYIQCKHMLQTMYTHATYNVYYNSIHTHVIHIRSIFIVSKYCTYTPSY